MPVMKPTVAPPDGWYWFRSSDPKVEDRVVRIYRSFTGNVYVSFPGTDYEANYGEEPETDGMYAPVAPAPWAVAPAPWAVAPTPTCRICGASELAHDEIDEPTDRRFVTRRINGKDVSHAYEPPVGQVRK